MKKSYESPKHMTMENIGRYSDIIEKMRKAGINEDDIEFILDFNHKDTLHVVDLMAKCDAHEAEKKTKVFALN